MNLCNLLTGVLPFGPCVVGVGTFDGVHIGHRALIETVIKRGKEQGLPSVVFTFDHSPRRLLDPENFPGEITPPEEKFRLLLQTGVNWVVFRPFEEAFALTSPREFVSDVLVRKLHAREVVVGFNFGFGVRREGNAAMLASGLAEHGVACRILPRVTLDGTTVSSTLVRQKIIAGEIEAANRFLGRRVSLAGTVVHGEKRGRTLGFPTANLPLEGLRTVLPPRGVYAGLVDTHAGTHYAMINIGVRPTFNRTQLLLEAHLHAFSGDLYSTDIRVQFLNRLRDERKFLGRDELIEQMRRDLAVVTHLALNAKHKKSDFVTL
ncbi:MAG: bifunctional riboflavin kinase/FAD synthetase [Candidatus Ozemobacteraceae bacterium]